jgi:hypothetical protein
VCALFLVLCAPAICTGQEFLPFQNIGVFDVGNVQLVPSLKFGYQRMAMNMNVPVAFNSSVGNVLYYSSSLDFKLQDAGVWIGGARVDARRGKVSLFLTADGSATKSARVSTTSEPFWAGLWAVDWRGSRLQWWSAEGGGAVNFGNQMAILAGFKAQHLSLGLADPVDPTGTLRRFQAVYGDRYSADLLTKLWVPYLGLAADGTNFKSTLVLSPYTWASVKIPFRYLFINAPGEYGYENAEYTFKRGGIFLEGTFDYRVRASANASCTLWFKGDWCRIRGRGNEDYRIDNTIDGITVFSFTNADSADGSFGWYLLAGGLSFDYAF